MTTRPSITEVMLARSTVAESVNSCAEQEHQSLSESERQFSFDQGASVHASVISVGSEAAKILHQHKHQLGRVLAVFDRSFYVQCHQDVFCVGLASLGRGPLQVLLTAEHDVLPFKVVSGESIRVKENLLHGAECDMPNPNRSTEKARTGLYSGKVVGRSRDLYSFHPVQEALTLLAPPRQTGFAWMPASIDWQHQKIDSLTTTAGTRAIDASLVKHSLPALKCLYSWLRSTRPLSDTEYPNSLSQVSALLGAGPGLTPSGDDLLAGVMLALHCLDRADLADFLWAVLEPHLQRRTNVISGAHLRMAALGQCSEPVLSLLNCVFNNSGCHQAEDVQVVAADIHSLANSIGASSGWDMLAGMSLVLRA